MKLERLIFILKEANLHKILLDDFEQDIIYDRSRAYAKFGDKIRITNKQELQLEMIADKLFLKGVDNDTKNS
jgi:hypothetical protein